MLLRPDAKVRQAEGAVQSAGDDSNGLELDDLIAGAYSGVVGGDEVPDGMVGDGRLEGVGGEGMGVEGVGGRS